ncbi:serine protease [Streptomyces sp. Ru71]|uniref:SSI family serine proteinase inhibitor n=1 Tax=Streptomyces sp. Ru71 TaxID=2080746 RepID=UPI000CDD7E27|nr:SSI family serine proteinase inhibitor [Streptomyces sp. Ru71]POX51829.1 serine protease [Streptomyces sp. Ru71]
MTHLTRSAAAGLLAATAVLTAAAPGTALATRHGDWLRLTVTRGDAGDALRALLRCDPPRGHTRAAEACAQLASVDGDIGALPTEKDAICPLIYAPVTAEARGRWHGRPVAYRETFANRCEMTARTGAVFAVDGGGGRMRG